MTRWRGYAWVLIWFVSIPFGAEARGSWAALAAFVVGAALGAAWQSVARNDVVDRLTWFAVVALASGLTFLLDAVIRSVTVSLAVGPMAYFVAVAASVIVTEQVLRRRDLGPVTLDMVHAADEPGAGGIRPPGPVRRTET